MMIRNGLLCFAERVVGVVIYAVILLPWILGYHVNLSRWYSPLYWLDGQRVVKCRDCGFSIQRRWEFCPRCGSLIQRFLIEEMERKVFAHKLNHMFKVKLKRNLDI